MAEAAARAPPSGSEGCAGDDKSCDDLPRFSCNFKSAGSEAAGPLSPFEVEAHSSVLVVCRVVVATFSASRRSAKAFGSEALCFKTSVKAFFETGFLNRIFVAAATFTVFFPNVKEFSASR